jgi:hypothetical protein
MLLMKIAAKALWTTLLTAAALGAAQQTTTVEARRLALTDARPVIEAYANALPEGLPVEATRDPKAWSKYIEQREKDLQARLEQGDLDTLANLLLFGTSFTTEPVLTPARLQQIAAQTQGTNKEAGSAGNAYQGRLRDLAIGIAYPKGNERLQYMRALLQKKGFQFATAEDFNRTGAFLASNLVRMLGDNQKLAEALQRAREADPETEFRERSQVFERRGISLDTSIFPNFALEEALKSLKEKGVLLPGSVRRVAIVGPGLDTINKDVGFDYYPEQTNQPFAVADSLLRLGLARGDQLQVTTLDISERVNAHIRAKRSSAQGGAGYTLQLPVRSNIEWKQEALDYWEVVGSAVGEKVPPLASPAGAGEPKTRAVKVRPAIVLRVRPRSLDVVYERLALPAGEKFDLIIGTNIFVYYGAFEQTLAELNLAAMLRDGGVVLTNDSLPTNGEAAALHEIGFSTTVYSERKNDGDRIVWLQGRAGPR